MTHINIPIEIGVRGDFKLEVYNTKEKRITQTRDWKQNLLLDSYLDRLFHPTNWCCLVNWTTETSGSIVAPTGESRCIIGDDNTPPNRSQTSLVSGVVSTSAKNSLRTLSDVTSNPSWRQDVFTFPAGTYVGPVREIGLASGTEFYVARQLVEPELELGENDQLTVTWRLSVDLGNRTWTGTIAGGQRDGITDVNWTMTINNAQLVNFLRRGTSNNRRDWFSDTHSQTPNFILGDSNAASDLANDATDTVKGNQLYEEHPPGAFKTIPDYVPGTYTQDHIFGFEHDDPSNVQIGEAIMSGRGGSSMARLTFDPLLDKAEFWRLFLTFTTTVVPD